MCGCTLYDSPTCGHSWLSMSQPCGFLADLLSCPNRSIYQTLLAPPYTCPMCNGGFADRETIEMIQGPWGCNQMIRNQVGGSYAVPGQWGPWSGPALTSDALVPVMSPSSRVAYDHRLTGPYSPGSRITNSSMVTNASMLGLGPVVFDDYDSDDSYCYRHHSGGRRKRKHRSSYKYRYSDRPATNCTVM